jgi:hypothetical protein
MNTGSISPLQARCTQTSPISPGATGLPSSSSTPAVAGITAPHGTELGRRHRRAVADDVVDLGLAVHLVHRHAQRCLRPGTDGFADGLAGAHDRAARGRISPSAAARPSSSSSARWERGRHVAYAVLLHQPEGLLRVEAAAVAQDAAGRKPSSAAARRTGRRSTPSRPATRTCRRAADRNRASRRNPRGCRSGCAARSARPSGCPWCRWCR